MTRIVSKMKKRYEKLDLLGEGTYAKVYRGRDTQKQSLVALKCFRGDDDDDGDYEWVPSINMMREISLLKELKHPNIIELLDVVVLRHGKKPPKVRMVIPYHQCHLGEYIMMHPGLFTRPQCHRFFVQLLRGLAYLHGHQVLHRDLKPPNILVNVKGTCLVIADFGMARPHYHPHGNLTPDLITIWYRAPELLVGLNAYNIASDVWSLGCVYAEMLCHGEPLFKGDHSEIDQLFTIFRQLGTPTYKQWPELKTLPNYSMTYPQWECDTFPKPLCNYDEELEVLKQLLVCNPSARVGARQLLASLDTEYKSNDDDDTFRLRQLLVKETKQPRQNATPTTYMPYHVSNRKCILEWIIGMSQRIRLRNETLHLTIALIDIYTQGRSSVPSEDYQCVSVACAVVASYMLEIYPPVISDFVFMAPFREDTIHKRFVHISETLEWRFNRVTAYVFLQHYLVMFTVEDTTTMDTISSYATYLLECALLQLSTRQYTESLIAATVFYYVRWTFTLKPYWPSQLAGVTKYNMKKDIIPCLRCLYCTWRQYMSKNNHTNKLYQKYSTEKFHRVASKIALKKPPPQLL